MEASAAEESTDSAKAFKSCGRTGRRGACIDTDITRDKLQDIIHKVEKVCLDETKNSQSNQGGEKGT